MFSRHRRRNRAAQHDGPLRDRTGTAPASWRTEATHLGRSGATLALNQLLQVALPFITTSMTGRLGVEQLAAGSLVTSIGLLLYLTALGVLQGMVPLVGSSLGSGDEPAAARVIRGGLAIALCMGVCATAIMACVPWALARSGQDPAVVALAQSFTLALLPGYLPNIMVIALRFMLVAVNELRWLNPVLIAGILFNVAGNLVVARGTIPVDGMIGIALTIVLTNWLMFALLVAAVLHARRIPKRLLARGGTLAVRDPLALGIPVGAILFTETLLFSGCSVVMGSFGKVPLAAHGIVMLWLNISLMIPVGIAQATMSRVAFQSGRRDPAAVRSAIMVAVAAGCLTSLATGTLMVTAPGLLVRIALWSRSSGGEAVAEAARSFFPFCAATQLFLGLIVVLASILRGLREPATVLWLMMLSYWGVGLGCALLLGVWFGWGGIGIWTGILLAFVTALGVLVPRCLAALAKLRVAAA